MSALGMASLGTQCEDKAIGMASLGVFCTGEPFIPQPVPRDYPSGGGGWWEWEPDQDKVQIKRIREPGEEFDATIDQILREDEELMELIITLIKAGVIP